MKYQQQVARQLISVRWNANEQMNKACTLAFDWLLSELTYHQTPTQQKANDRYVQPKF